MTKIVGHTTENVKLLPAWAQRQIRNLTSEVERLQSLVARLPADQTNVALVDHQGEYGLPADARVRFRFKRHTIDVSICKDRGGFEVRTNDGYLTLLPAASNVVHVQVNFR